MRAGRIRHRITIQQATEIRDALGGVTQTWTDLRTVWAAVEPARGSERFALAQAKAGVDSKIVLRGPVAKDVTPKMRILFGARIFDIEAVIDVDSRNIVRELFIKEAV